MLKKVYWICSKVNGVKYRDGWYEKKTDALYEMSLMEKKYHGLYWIEHDFILWG